MAVSESAPDDKPARAVSAADRHPPCPAREGPDPVATDGIDERHAGDKEKPVASDSSDFEHEDGHDEHDDEHDEHDNEHGQDIEVAGRGQGEPHAPGLALQKTATSHPQSRYAASFAHTDIVPRAQRRGLLSRFAIVPEVERPYEYRNGTKWTITAVVALAAAAAPMGSGIFLRERPCPYSRRMQIRATNRSLQLPSIPCRLNWASRRPSPTSPSRFTCWPCPYFPCGGKAALLSLLFSAKHKLTDKLRSSFSETTGRRTVYIISFSLSLVFSILSAVSVNISMLIPMRVLGGGAAASVQAVGAGTIADIWEPAARGRAMGIFYLGPLVGPLCAPIVGGALAQGFGWRATMWFLSIYGGVMILLLIFCLPETLAKPPPLPPAATEPSPNPLQRVSTTQSVRLHTRRTAAVLKRFLVDPLSVILYLRLPPVFITVYSASIAFFALFVLNISIQSTFSSPPYGFPPIPLGACYLAPSLGYVVASVLGGPWIDYIMAREARRAERFDDHGNLVYLPEDRVRENMWLAAVLYPGAMVWFGWTAQKGVHFMVPSVANFFFGLGSMLVFGVTTTMLTEFMPRRSSSGVAVNNLVRNMCSCVGSVIAQPLIEAMGVGWLCTMVGLLALVTGNAALWALKRYGAKWRVDMDRKLNEGGVGGGEERVEAEEARR